MSVCKIITVSALSLFFLLSGPILVHRHYEHLEFKSCVTLGGNVGSEYGDMTCTLKMQEGPKK